VRLVAAFETLIGVDALESRELTNVAAADTTLGSAFDDQLRFAVIGCSSFIVVVVAVILLGVCVRRLRPCAGCSTSDDAVREHVVPVVIVGGGGSGDVGGCRAGGYGLTPTQPTHTGFIVDSVCSSRSTAAYPARSLQPYRHQQLRR
jgi:hypothetical protein